MRVSDVLTTRAIVFCQCQVQGCLLKDCDGFCSLKLFVSCDIPCWHGLQDSSGFFIISASGHRAGCAAGPDVIY